MYVEQIWMFQYSPVSQQCNVLSWHSCGCHLTFTICLNTVVDQAYPLMAAGLICLTSRTLCPQKLLRNGSRTWQRAQGVQIPQIPIWSSICGTCENKSDQWRPPPPNIQDPKKPLQMCQCQTPQDASRGLITMSSQVRAALAAQGKPTEH